MKEIMKKIPFKSIFTPVFYWTLANSATFTVYFFLPIMSLVFQTPSGFLKEITFTDCMALSLVIFIAFWITGFFAWIVNIFSQIKEENHERNN